MPAVMEAIDRMSFADKVKTMEYLVSSISAAGASIEISEEGI